MTRKSGIIEREGQHVQVRTKAFATHFTIVIDLGSLRRHSGARFWAFACLVALFALAPSQAEASPIELSGQWYVAPEVGSPILFDEDDLQAVDGPSRTGGRFWYQAELVIDRADTYVLDFKNSSTIGRFRHRIFNAEGRLVAESSGGIQANDENPFFLRHGRELTLQSGRYRLLTEVDSPFYLADPEPYADTLRDYRQSVKLGNALVLVGLGIFLGLGLYYAALALVRKRVADAMYALFILGNLLYNGTALLVYPDLFGLRWIYLVSVPILFSNVAYIVFVLALLEIRPSTHPRLYRSGLALIALFVAFIATAAVQPHWSLELDRYGVGLFVVYGLVAAIHRAREGDSSAKVYLIAIATFSVLGLASISLSRLDAYTLYVEHIGLVAVVVEVALLALVLAHQFSLLQLEKDSAVRRASQSVRFAYTDALTGLPNRYQLEAELSRLPSQGSLTFIDLDGLKHYNDKYGHSRGDDLLCGFAKHLKQGLGNKAALYRLGGDEFAITCASGDVTFIAQTLERAVEALRRDDFELIGASFGSVHVHEDPTRDSLKHMADTRMYEQKGQRRMSGRPIGER